MASVDRGVVSPSDEDINLFAAVSNENDISEVQSIASVRHNKVYKKSEIVKTRGCLIILYCYIDMQVIISCVLILPLIFIV